MDYHACNRSQDDIIWMSVDGSEFMDIEEKWPHFNKEPWNFIFSLATDGVNLFWRDEIYLLGVAYLCYQQ